MQHNRLQTLFKRKQKEILSVYFTAGFPSMNSAPEIISELASGGIDMIEVGVPFSDPLADGVVIQESSTEALRNGITLPKILEQVKEAREKNPDIPLVLMGYLNPMFRYGIGRLFRDVKEAGADALIIPDLPFNEYLTDFLPLCREYDLPVIMLITPETSAERIKLIDENCSGFIYMVSAASTTGTRDSFSEEQQDYFRRINNMELRNPRLIGFGISNPQTLSQAWKYSSGAIIGSLFIKCLRKSADAKEAVRLLKETIGL